VHVAELPEAIIEENITDIDSEEVGTIEVDLAGSIVRANHGAGGAWSSNLEAEWRAIRGLGLGLEVATGAAADGFAPKEPAFFGVRPAASYTLLQDFSRELFLQGEVSARFTSGPEDAGRDVTDAALPYAAGLRWATQLRPITLRAGAFGEGGGNFAHAPVRGSLAALWDIPVSLSHFDLGGEVVADWARTSPFMVMPEALFFTPIMGKPLRFGFGMPFTLGAKGDDGAWGFAFRIVAEPED
jgi:hypothetical protein